MANWAIGLVSFITLFTVIVCSGMVASEFSDGTIKQLLIRPHKRWKIVLLKYVHRLCLPACCFSRCLYLVICSASSFSGMVDLRQKSLIHPFQVIWWRLEAISWICSFIGFRASLSLSQSRSCWSTLFKTTSITVGLGVYLVSSLNVNFVILNLVDRYSWLKFILFPHLDLRSLFCSILGYEGASIGFSLGLLAVYYIVFFICYNVLCLLGKEISLFKEGLGFIFPGLFIIV